MRVQSLTGLWLVLFPSLSGILLASTPLSWKTLFYLILFTIGAALMRPAGCIINDICDRKIDASVKRTKYRPLACGMLNIKQALILLFLLLFISLIVLLLTNITTFILGVISLSMIIIYPLLKRYTWYPQLFLGFTFNMGALMGWTAIRNEISLAPISFYIGCIFWTLFYDTIYAYQDKLDDKRVGVKSTALYFGDNAKPWLKKFNVISLTMWFYTGILLSFSSVFYVTLIAIALIFYYQHKNFDGDNPVKCMKIFKNNTYIGLLLFCAILTNQIISTIQIFYFHI